jgi:hypothetical protein
VGKTTTKQQKFRNGCDVPWRWADMTKLVAAFCIYFANAFNDNFKRWKE